MASACERQRLRIREWRLRMSDRVTVEFKLRLSMTRPDPSSYARYHEYATANISDAFFKRQTLPHDSNRPHVSRAATWPTAGT